MFRNMKIDVSRKIAGILGALPFVPGRYLITEFLAHLMWTEQDRSAIARLPGGGFLTVDMKEWSGRQMYLGIYETDETKLIKSLLRPGSIFIDGGANIGYFTVIAAAIVGNTGKVYSFEPVPWLNDILSSNIAINHFSNVVISNVALSSFSGITDLYVSEVGAINGAASMASSPRRQARISVETISLDEYLRNLGADHVDLIKLDIEGAEVQALKGAYELLSRPDAPALIVEVNPFLLQRLNIPIEMIEHIITGYGYTLKVIGKVSRSSSLKPYNVLAIKK